MAEAIKNYINPELVNQLADNIVKEYDRFDKAGFIKYVINDTWNVFELKQRINHVATGLHQFLPLDFPQVIAIIDRVITQYDNLWSVEDAWFFLTYIEMFGQADEHWEVAVAAMGRYTKHSSAEFAVRPFIMRDEARMMAQMYEWAQHENEHLRRLASEGCRPALPWAPALPKYKKDPTPILPILEQLKADPSLYVRKSVANNLNDISKTHPELVVAIAQKWYGSNADTNWIVKHACRTLLKQGNPDALAIFGYHDTTVVDVQDFALSTNTVAIGNSFNFSFKITALKATKLRLEYGIDFVKANGKRNRKIFQISESELKMGQQKSYDKKHSFADLSTRKHYTGLHAITLIVNGAERGTLEFEVTN